MPAVPSVAFPFKGSDSASYSGQTVPLDAAGAVPTSVADGSSATVGARADAAYADATLAAAGSLIALLKGLYGKLAGLLSVDTVVKATAASRSGTITAGGTAQALMPANTSRRGFAIQNQSSGPLFFSGTGMATADQNSMILAPGDYFATDAHHVGTGAISILGATTGQAFYAREF